MILFGIKSFLKSLGYVAAIFFVTGIVTAIGDACGAQYSLVGIIVLSCISVSLLSIFMFYYNHLMYYDQKTMERGERIKGKSSNMPWEFYKKLKSRKPIKAKRVYICMFAIHWVIAVAFICLLIIYSSVIAQTLDLSYQNNDGEPAAMLMLVILLIDNIIIQLLYPLSMIHAIREVTCRDCGCVFSGMEVCDYNFRDDKGTWYTTETRDVQLGTLRAGDKSIGIYGQQDIHYKQDYTYHSHTTKCACVYCGHEYDRHKSRIVDGKKERY